jgi:hypothetical protein
MSYLDKKYVLTIEETEYLLSKYIKPKYKDDVEYKVRQSDWSKSIYIEVKYKDFGRTIRLSDHPDPNRHSVYHYIGRATKNLKIVNIVKNVIKKLHVKFIETEIKEKLN